MKKMIQTNIMVVILYAVLYAGLAVAHGKVELAQDSCVRGIEGSRVHFSTYQPQFDPDAQYCSEVPKVGKTYWVVDLVDQALRDMLVGVKIVKGSGKVLSNEVVASFAPANYPDGVIKGESNLDEGVYTVLVTGEGIPPVHFEYPLQVHIKSFFSDSRFSYATGPIIALLILALLWFVHNGLRSRRVSH